jgi:hypothetical protein
MKLTLALLVPTIFLLEISSPATPPGIRGTLPVAAIASQEQETEAPAVSSQTLIEPGARVGPLKLGDSRDRALELFPRKGEDQEWDDKCGGGTTLDWVDSQNSTGHGDLYIRINKKGKIFQIDSATTRFRTAEGITTFDHADKVAENYKDLRAYTMLSPPVPALGDRPLVYWIDKKNGIAFVFAYYPRERKRYIYKIIVFEPNKNICPEEDTTNSPKWQSIPSYSLEPPPELAPNMN